jgi:IS30 family transposase
MTTSFEEESEIIRLYVAEKWKIGTIANHLSKHHSTVYRIIDRHKSQIPNRMIRNKKSILSEYDQFIRDTLEKYPRICGSRIFHMLKERGYKGKHPNLYCARA